jgi:hypothetical protein
MTRSVGRLNEVVHSLNPMTVGIYSLVNIHAAMNRIIAGSWVDPTLHRALAHVATWDPSPHLRDLAQDALTIINEKGLTNG